MKVPVCVLRTAGTNCDRETVVAFEMAGAAPERVHVGRLVRREARLGDFRILALPGGFTYGDDVAAGRILATELREHLADEVYSFIAAGNLVIGICNGFQVLVKMGLLPGFGRVQEAALAANASGRFECRWIRLRPGAGRSPFLEALGGEPFPLPVAHGEGRFLAPGEVLERIEGEDLVALRYCDDDGEPTGAYPANPNGSAGAIAGITDPTGRVLGLMPHPERFVRATQHPAWTRREAVGPGVGLAIFQGAVKAMQE